MHLARPEHVAAVRSLLGRSPVVLLLGPRQVGKSTLAREVARAFRTVTTFDLESPPDERRLSEPSQALSPLRGLVVIDEIQTRPDLFAILRVLADRPRTPARFLLLGSAAPDLLQRGAETLAGRVAFHELTGFDLSEAGSKSVRKLWLRGGFPPSYTARTLATSAAWRRDFVRTFLERDIPQLGVTIPTNALRRFWSMLAHVHGQVTHWSELGRALAVADTTVRRYLDVLVSALVVTELRPWHENISKRQVKAPKVYVKDSGLLHTLLDVETQEALDGHAKVGASWEGFCVEQVIARLGARRDQTYFWATHAGAELDLLLIARGKRRGFEMKYSDAPFVTPSMRAALLDLRLDSLDVIHAGKDTYPLADRVRAVALERITRDL
jgi:hypothetical protein